MNEDEHVQEMADHVASTQSGDIEDLEAKFYQENLELTEEARDEELNAYDDVKRELEEKQK